VTAVLIAIGSVKGSPGATSLVVGLAARWPTTGAVVVEADPAGGDLAFRFGHHREPGLSELAADTRGGDTGRGLAAYSQRLTFGPNVGVDVVVAPAEREATQALRLLSGTGPRLLREAAADRAVLVDVGRLGPDSPALPLACAADVLLLVTRGWPDGVDAVQVRRDRLLALPGMRSTVALVLAGDLPCAPKEVAQVVGLPVAGRVPTDPRGAAVLAGRARPGRGWTRLELLRAARALASSLHTYHRSESRGSAGHHSAEQPSASAGRSASPLSTDAASRTQSEASAGGAAARVTPL